MFIGMAIIFIGLVAIIWSTAYFLTKAVCAVAESRERKRIEAREKKYWADFNRAREESAKRWAKRYAQMTEEEWDDFNSCPFI